MPPRRLVLVGLFAVLLAASIAPLRNYDLFWHLATGRWIAEHRALPLHDPFAVASDRAAWINGEWLFELFAHAVGDPRWMSILRGALAAAIFTIAFASSRGGWPLRLALTALAFAGAAPLLDFRPSSWAVLLLACAIPLAERRATLAYAVLSVLWINVHPSALLAPLIGALLSRSPLVPLASFAALFVNPYGWRALAAPVELTRFARSGAFVNAEWLPSAPLTFPLLYLALAIGIGLLALRWRAELPRVLVFAVLAYLAVAHVRNQGLFFAAFPLLMPPFERDDRLLAMAAALIFAFAAVAAPHGVGLMPGRFPVDAVARLKASGLRGTIYNPDQFGGYLIWSFYPERRTLTDGRNELYRTFIPEYARARGDERAWRALLRKYRIDLAVDEYRPPLPVIDVRSGAGRLMPASLAYWPRREWALIGYDGVAMVFARRAAFGRALERWEIAGEAPDSVHELGR